MADSVHDSLADWLFIDLETDLNGRVFKVAGVRGEDTISLTGADCLARAHVDLDRMSEGATGVAGHNIVDHDLPVLRQFAPNLKLHTLPVADTLLLSPICFPENPYHRLVKDYKLVPQSRNDPLLDAHLSSVLFRDECSALNDLAVRHTELFVSLDAVLGNCSNEPLTQGWKLLTGHHASTVGFSIPAFLQNLTCSTAFARRTRKLEGTDEQRWALAYALSWLRVSGARSVLPPWVRHRFPFTMAILDELRNTPCDAAGCEYCRSVFNPENQLSRYFGFDTFRLEPAASDGTSLQRAITVAGFRNESLLAIMPTGGGKSLCFQLPALTRNFRRGQLTVVVSPLQSLMKDQVDGLIRRTGMDNAAALYGMLTLPERGDVLRRTAMGDLAILYVSPEQLRNRSVRKALANREIGCWVMDEAHCLSKWGHDFRPDYLYVGRFIRELATAQQSPVPSIACFTATAKPDVIEEILAYFRLETGTALMKYEGGVERNNLHFEVQTVGGPGRLPRIDELLRERLGAPGKEDGVAVVFRATRRMTEDTMQYLKERGWSTECFHAGLTAPEKKRIQNAFIDGSVQVICATNAFGMGIDKDNVRVVIHGDTPGSLENYLQEAGRAGRDRADADCILLYSEEDCEAQFRLGAYSELSRNDIAQILRGLRKAARQRSSDEVVITTGELLRDEDVETGFEADDRMADTKVRSAIAWLERAGLVERNDNQTNVIQARPLVGSIDEARAALAKLSLSERETGLWLAIIRELLDAERNESITVDEIALLPEFRGYVMNRSDVPAHVIRDGRSMEYVSAKVLHILHTMMQAGILKKDTLLTAFVRYKVADHSSARFERLVEAERALIGLLPELAPDPEGWLRMDTRLVSAELEARGATSSPELVRKLMRGFSEDGRGFAGQEGSIDLRPVGRDQFLVKIKRKWPLITELSDRRRRIARILLEALLAKIPSEAAARSDILVSFSFEDLMVAVDRDAVLKSEIRDPLAAIERGLMYLHEQGVIVLQQGLSIFRSAMAIKVFPDMAGQRYTKENYEALELHYRERIFQVHVMNAYAQAALRKIEEALHLVVSYFSMSKELFIERFFRGQRALLELATTERSYRRIVDALNNKDQIRMVTASPRRNLLVLAGPGSGKTKVVVHRVAYLLRVRRVKPTAILVCCFNHKAAVELRRRLIELVGRDAIGVMVQTYHSLSLRLLGKSAKAWVESSGDAQPDFDTMIRQAIALLKEEKIPPGMEPDEVRDRLLAGFEYILVDEYQDIDEPQYELISAMAGRTLEDSDRKLAILAVGDDDQNIYTFRGANVEFIRRFKTDYDADELYLIENYRSTRYIIEAANQVIIKNHDRMKTEHPIRIDRSRELLQPGGLFGANDPKTRGRVAVVRTGDLHGQAASVVHELHRLKKLGVTSWNHMAVLARHRKDIACIRAVAEAEGIPVSWPLDRDNVPALHRLREIRIVLDDLLSRKNAAVSASELLNQIPDAQGNPWRFLIRGLLEDWANETGETLVPASACLDFLYEALGQKRRDETWGQGVVLQTVHGAKGCEYPHVLLCGDWSMASQTSIEEERRAFYVGMTRARDTLSIFIRSDVRHPFAAELTGAPFSIRQETRQPALTIAATQYTALGMSDIFIDYAGWRTSGDPVHAALSGLAPGDRLQLMLQGERIEIQTMAGTVISQLSRSAFPVWTSRLDRIRSVRVIGVVTRFASDVNDAEYRKKLAIDRWEVPWLEVEWSL
ncbi:MAG TPA: RecQ family ATP-dependent DNA helicase [Kiritimatiellia bacterium]|nr:RecQ family ATP-dependent DNA helicase [Kiritimatiellia bacterium]